MWQSERSITEIQRSLISAESGTGNGEEEKADDECRMANDECQMADDEWQAAGGEPRTPIQDPELPREVGASGRDDGLSSEPMTERGHGPIVGHDSNRVMDDSRNDKIGILSHEAARAVGQAARGDSAGQDVPESKIQNRQGGAAKSAERSFNSLRRGSCRGRGRLSG